MSRAIHGNAEFICEFASFKRCGDEVIWIIDVFRYVPGRLKECKAALVSCLTRESCIGKSPEAAAWLSEWGLPLEEAKKLVASAIGVDDLNSLPSSDARGDLFFHVTSTGE